MSAFPNIVFGSDNNKWDTYTDRRFTLGTAMYLVHGARFRFGLAGALQIAGTMVQSFVPLSTNILMTPSAAAVGAQSVSVTLGAAALVADQFRDGQLLVTTTNTGDGYSYGVDTHASALSGAVFIAPLKRGETVQVAIGTTANSVSLYSNPFWKFIITPATAATAPILGVTPGATASASYGWVQTRGLAATRVDASTIVVGAPVVNSAATAGDVALLTTANFITNWTVGTVAAVGSSTHAGLIDLRLE